MSRPESIRPFRFQHGSAAFLLELILGFGYFAERFGGKAYAEQSIWWAIGSMFAAVIAMFAFWLMLHHVKDECARERAHELEARKRQA